jgi:pimeloyl-ACP methyl ester carboxylesterase
MTRRLLLALVATTLLGLKATAEPAPGLRHDFVAAPDGVPLAVTECGSQDSPPVLLLHGYGQSYLSFQSQLTPELCARLHLVAFDLRGHGGSGKPWDAASYDSRERWADDVQAVIEAKKLERPLVVGWSFGGIVAVHYVKVHGAAGIRGLMLVGSSGGLVPPSSLASGLSPERMAAVARAAATPDIPGQVESANWFVSVLTAKPLPAAVTAELVHASLMLPAYARAAMKGLPVDNAGLEGILTMPVRFVLGAHDSTRDIAQHKALAARLAKGSAVVFDDSGHSPFLEEPARFNEELVKMARGT